MAARMTFKEFQAQFEKEAFDEYRVKMKLKTVAGGTPVKKELIAGWINATCKDKSAEEREKLVNATIEQLPEVADDKEAQSWVTFKRDPEGYLFLEGRCVKSGLKEAGNIVKALVMAPARIKKAKGGKKEDAPKDGAAVEAKEEKGIPGLKSKIADRCFVVEEKIYFMRNGQKINKPDESPERPIHVMTAQGERSSLKKSDILRDVEIEFTVRNLADKSVPENALYAAISYLKWVGLGADRSQGFGQSEGIEVEPITIQA